MSYQTEEYKFKDNCENKLPKISLQKTIIYIGYCLVIIFFIGLGLVKKKLYIPIYGHEFYFKNYSLYILLLAGLLWIYHLVTQILGGHSKTDDLNNSYFKQAYNTRVIAIILMIMAIILSYFYDPVLFPKI